MCLCLLHDIVHACTLLNYVSLCFIFPILYFIIMYCKPIVFLFLLNSSDRCSDLFFRIDLDHDHYGLEKLKKRVIEYLAVRKLKNSLKGKIM